MFLITEGPSKSVKKEKKNDHSKLAKHMSKQFTEGTHSNEQWTSGNPGAFLVEDHRNGIVITVESKRALLLDSDMADLPFSYVKWSFIIYYYSTWT